MRHVRQQQVESFSIENDRNRLPEQVVVRIGVEQIRARRRVDCGKFERCNGKIPDCLLFLFLVASAEQNRCGNHAETKKSLHGSLSYEVSMQI